MIIAGAGGHGLEVLQLLLNQGFDAKKIIFFDEEPTKKHNRLLGRPVVTTWDEIREEIIHDSTFCLGVGNPVYRKKLTEQFENLGGKLFGLSGRFIDSIYKDSVGFDQMSYSFVGPETKIGKGVLINTRANLHHESQVGEYTEIGPGAMLLGGVRVGKMCRIGAGAIVLPGVELGNNVIVGAGAVVTNDKLAPGTIKGVPAR
ncbi:acetyltransferase [Algoriphagus formosus]|uniref:acetyltransferase n=1 Tax=Algoriphagus formosus TaxID=2007308 RepID=UPI003F6F8AC2